MKDATVLLARSTTVLMAAFIVTVGLVAAAYVASPKYEVVHGKDNRYLRLNKRTGEVCTVSSNTSDSYDNCRLDPREMDVLKERTLDFRDD